MTNALVVVLLASAAVGVVLIVSYNRFVSQRQQIASAWATIDAEIDRRHVLVPQWSPACRHRRSTNACSWFV